MTAASRKLIYNEMHQKCRAMTRQLQSYGVKDPSVHRRFSWEWPHLFRLDPNRLGNLRGLDWTTRLRINQEWYRFKMALTHQVVTAHMVIAMHPVFFVDDADYHEADYVVASGVICFARFLLRDEHYLRGEQRYSPFDRERVLAEDPMLAAYRGIVPLPWDRVRRAVGE